MHLFALALLAPMIGSPVAPAPERGVALGLFASDPRYDYGPLLDEIRDLGATDVELDVVWTQHDRRSARIHRTRGITPDDATVLRTLRQAKARGLRALLFPIVRLEQRSAKEWRGRIDPAAGKDAWFSSYGDFLDVMAGLAAQGGAAGLSVGSELVSLEDQEAHWRALIARARARFPGRLLYSANWDHFDEVPFWDAVDEVGVTGYFELATDDALPSAAALDAAWGAPRAALVALKERTHKPLVVTEVGYPSLVGAAHRPWDETRVAAVDVLGQARLISSFCRAMVGAGVVDGFYVWNWFGTGAQDGSYSPRGKPAAADVARCLAAPSAASGRFLAPAVRIGAGSASGGD